MADRIGVVSYINSVICGRAKFHSMADRAVLHDAGDFRPSPRVGYGDGRASPAILAHFYVPASRSVLGRSTPGGVGC